MPPSNHFEKLSGNLRGWHSIRVNRQWRLIFRWNGETGEATGIIWTSMSIARRCQ
jgi:proteic killer suppression protein